MLWEKKEKTQAHTHGLRCLSAPIQAQPRRQSFTSIHTDTHIHTGRGRGVHPGCTYPSLHRKPLHADTALRDAAAMHYSPFLNMDPPVFTPFYTVCVIRGASEGKQKWQARHMDELVKNKHNHKTTTSRQPGFSFSS